MVTKKDRAAILAAIQKDAAFNRALQRRYREPQGFAGSRPWVEAAAIAAYLLKTGKAELISLNDYQQQFAALSLAYIQASELPPHYWVGEALTEALWLYSFNTEGQPPLVHPFVEQLVLHFPWWTINNVTDGGMLREIHCLYCREGEVLEKGEFPSVTSGARLLYTVSMTGGESFAGVLALGEGHERAGDIHEDGLATNNGETHHKTGDSKPEQTFTQEVEFLLYQLLLLIQEQPELIEVGRDEAKFARMSRSKQKKRLAQSNLPFSPNWIGRSYTPPRENTQSEAQEQLETGYTPTIAEIEPEGQTRGGSPIRSLSSEE